MAAYGGYGNGMAVPMNMLMQIPMFGMDNGGHTTKAERNSGVDSMLMSDGMPDDDILISPDCLNELMMDVGNPSSSR
jgi:hypothetical protein